MNKNTEARNSLKLSGNMLVIPINRETGEAEITEPSEKGLEYTEKEKRAAIIVDAVFTLISENTDIFLSIELFNEAIKTVAERLE